MRFDTLCWSVSHLHAQTISFVSWGEAERNSKVSFRQREAFEGFTTRRCCALLVLHERAGRKVLGGEILDHVFFFFLLPTSFVLDAAALAPEQFPGYPWVAAESKRVYYHYRLPRVSDGQCCGELQVDSVFYRLLGWEEGFQMASQTNMGQRSFSAAVSVPHANG